MAFFKFRFPGQSASASVDAVASGPSENIEVVRKRARHRLIGSVVLVLVAVVLVLLTRLHMIGNTVPTVTPTKVTATPSSPTATTSPAPPTYSARVGRLKLVASEGVTAKKDGDGFASRASAANWLDMVHSLARMA